MHLADALMEHFLEGSAPLRLWEVNSEKKICICYSSLLGLCTNVLAEQFIQGNVSLGHLLNEETLFISRRRSIIKEVNDWALNLPALLLGFTFANYVVFAHAFSAKIAL